MKFFNKKQDVIDIQLTSYGREKLAAGRFKPTYYCFFDDNVLYDGAYASLTETQNSIQTRILENMQYLKINPLAKGPETKINERNKEIFEGDNEILEMKDYYGESIQNSEDRDTICKYKLGNTKLDIQKAPSFTMESAGASFDTDNFINHYTGSGYVQEIPQINVNLKHTATKMVASLSEGKSEEQEYMYPSDITENGFIIELKGDYLAIDLLESNVDYTKENFEFEIYEIVTKERKERKDSEGNLIPDDVTEELVPLQLENTTGFPSTDPEQSFINKYFEVMTDNQIPEVIKRGFPNVDNSRNSSMSTFDEQGGSSAANTGADSAGSSPYTGNNQDPEDCK